MFRDKPGRIGAEVMDPTGRLDLSSYYSMDDELALTDYIMCALNHELFTTDP